MLLLHITDLEHFVKYASLDVIWFLVGMMIILAMLKDTGVFYYITTKILCIKNLTGVKIFIYLLVISYILSGIMDEVTSIILVSGVVFSLCDFLEISPLPLLISCIITTNIGSATTVLGNPIGVLIAIRGKLSFEDFIINSMPLTIICLVFSIAVLTLFYRKYIKKLSEKLKPHIENDFFMCLISTPMEKEGKISSIIFLITILIIALHRRLELLLNLEENTILIMVPIIIAGFVLIVNKEKAKEYIEKEVEWNSLLFFLFLFAQAGVIQYSGIAEKIAEKIINLSKNKNIISFSLLFSSGFLSSVLDNVVVVASYIPIVNSLKKLIVNNSSFWWAILWGGCFGGNITMIGSTANIIALGLLEKKYNIKVNFFDWLKIGLLVGFLTMIISYLFIIIFF
ncbi:MAG: SLC13 family permease [Elusimicrobiota bacterium]|nr:SLC13 family permease [Endomicrobiia bacterium]MDW8165783.1 SLC13 family permease [Elusimicrobiota bacterium]